MLDHTSAHRWAMFRQSDARAGLEPPEAELLDAVRAATARAFIDPVMVNGLPMRRRDARTIERVLVKLGRANLSRSAGCA